MELMMSKTRKQYKYKLGNRKSTVSALQLPTKELENKLSETSTRKRDKQNILNVLKNRLTK